MKTKQMSALAIGLMMLATLLVSAAPWTEYRITTSPAHQMNPDIDGNIVVWEDYRHVGRPIYAADISDPNLPLVFQVSAQPSLELLPTVGGNIIVWKGDGQEVCGYNISTQTEFSIYPNGIVGGMDEFTAVWIWIAGYEVKGYDIQTKSVFTVRFFVSDKYNPDVSNNIVVWRDNRNVSQDIYGFDMSTWQEFTVCTHSGSQYKPAVDGNIVVWADGRNTGNTDIYAADIADPTNPVEFPICVHSAHQFNPAVSGNIVVWEDARNGNRDIYGYDMSTQTEFQITDDAGDQKYPAISGHTVVWEDRRQSQYDIYATILYGPQVPKCLSPVEGDINGDCKLDFLDLSILTKNWLECNLEPADACWN